MPDRISLEVDPKTLMLVRMALTERYELILRKLATARRLHNLSLLHLEDVDYWERELVAVRLAASDIGLDLDWS